MGAGDSRTARYRSAKEGPPASWAGAGSTVVPCRWVFGCMPRGGDGLTAGGLRPAVALTSPSLRAGEAEDRPFGRAERSCVRAALVTVLEPNAPLAKDACGESFR